MLISLSKKFVFVATLKTASTSIEKVLRTCSEVALIESRFGKHQPFSQIESRFAWVLNLIEPKELLVFAVIRDPVDYMVSLYNSHMNPKFKANSGLYTGDLDFERFLSEWTLRNEGHIRQQYTRLLDQQGRIAANFIISYSKLEEGLAFIGKRIGVKTLESLSRENPSYGSFDATTLTAANRSWIETQFAQDRELLNTYCDRLLPNRPYFPSSEFNGEDVRQADSPSERTKMHRRVAPIVGEEGGLESPAENIIFVHSHRRSGTHFLLDTIRTWFDVPDEVQAIPNPAIFPRVAPKYPSNSLSKDHEPFRGYKFTRRNIWGPLIQMQRGRDLYNSGRHIYIVRNPLHVLRSAYIFDLSAAEPKFMIDPGTTFLEYLTAPSLHEGNTGLDRLAYWVTHLKSWYFDEDTLPVHYDELKTNLPKVLAAISEHLGLPVRQTPRTVAATGIATKLTTSFLAKGQAISWDSELVARFRSVIETILGPKPWRGLEQRVAHWLSEPPTA